MKQEGDHHKLCCERHLKQEFCAASLNCARLLRSGTPSSLVENMQAIRIVRRFCTLQAQEQLINFDNLAAPLRHEARQLTSALREARDAVSVAKTEGSDDDERREALLRVKNALRRYSELAARGDPPVQLSEYGRTMENVENTENDVTRVFGHDTDALKKEIFESNRQRVWIGWWGWF